LILKSAFLHLPNRLIKKLVNLDNNSALGKLGDFTAGPHLLLISLIALALGVVSAFLAVLLLALIGFFTNLFFFGRLSTELVSPMTNNLGIFEIFVPVVGALIIGTMARFGSERIRGHGIPEAIEAILINGSRIEPKVALLKPISSAISIGSGGPFGAEGPIIMTGGAVGSIIAQFFHLTSSERKTLLVAGAAAGMSATFAAPMAAVLLAVELLLFEWKPRSLIPVGLASAMAAIVRYYLLGAGPLFPVPSHPEFIGPLALAGCLVVGLLAGVLSLILTSLVYASEDIFSKLPIHWMWWPAFGGLIIGVGGLIFPRALGVGYDTIGTLLQGRGTIEIIGGVLLVKSTIWAVSLGSGTSGGVLAPLLMMGSALGGLEAGFLPAEGAGFWAFISMGAILGGTMRSPLTGIIFVLELTHDLNALLPLLIASMVAHGFTVLFMRRSILTEKVSRRGFHLSREYGTDPLEIIFVREVMRNNLAVLPARTTLDEIRHSLNLPGYADESAKSTVHTGYQHLYPVVDAAQKLTGVVTRKDLYNLLARSGDNTGKYPLTDLIKRNPVVAYADEPLRAVVYRMAEVNLTRLPVVERNNPTKLVGMVSLTDLLKARVRNLEEERDRNRVLHLHFLFRSQAREQSEIATKI
jgi:CIC family chloride channel protein